MHREPPASAAALVQRLLDPACPPFALLHRRTPGRDAASSIVEVLTGEVTEVERLADIPLGEGVPDAPVTDALALIPFRQIRERGFRAHDDGTPLAVLRPRETAELPLDDILAALPAHDVRVTDGAFDVDDEAYAGIVGRVVRDEIGTGEGANFVIRRTFEGEIADFSAADALALFRRLLAGERGAYWTYVVHRPGCTRWSAPAPRCMSGLRRDGRDESDQRHLPLPGGRPHRREPAGVPRRPQGGRGAVHGGGRGAEDDVHRRRQGRCGGRAAAQGDGASRAHRVRAARPVHPRCPRGAPGDDVRGDGHRVAGAERLPGDRAARAGGRRRPGARLLRGGAGADRAGHRRRADTGLADPDPDRRYLRRGTAAGAGRCHPRTRLRSARRGRRDARQGRGGAERAGCAAGARAPCGRGGRRGWPTTRGCGPRWTPDGQIWRRSGCGCRPPRPRPS